MIENLSVDETEIYSEWEKYLSTLDFQGVDITYEDLMLAYMAGYRKAKEDRR